jgi:hypothetical protein
LRVWNTWNNFDRSDLRQFETESDWRNIYHALGHDATEKDFTPRSVFASEVINILRKLLPDFTKELADACLILCAHRNAELHGGEQCFAGLTASTWLPKYYASCEILLRSMKKNLSDFFSDPKIAEEMIAALLDTAAKAVAQDIERHRQMWDRKSADEQRLASAQASTLATRNAGHRTDCPACGNTALLRGQGRGAVTTLLDEDEYEIVQRQTMLPSSFECFACELKISGLSKLSACGLGNVFTTTWRSSVPTFFDLHTDEELQEAEAEAEASAAPEWEEDNNE